MTDFLTATTELEAVNWGLKELGFTQVNSLEGTIGRDASAVQTALRDEVRNLCRRGLWFARRNVTLTPNDDGFLVLPNNALSISYPEPDSLSTGVWSMVEWKEDRPVIRDGKVFSVIRQSYEYEQPMTVLMREALAFEDIPEEARAYAQVVAAETYNGGSLRSEAVSTKLTPLIAQKWSDLMNAELDNSNRRFI